MKLLAISLVLLAASCAAVGPHETRPAAEPRSFGGSVDLYYGVRGLDEDDWAPVENQGMIGIEVVLEKPDSAVGFELGLFGSGRWKDDVSSGGGQFDVAGTTTELSVGLHKTFHPGDGPVRPYVGGGISAIHASFHGESGGVGASDSDGSAGVYLHGGVAYDLSANLFLALDLRVLGGTEIEIFGSDGTADYGQAALVFGVRF